ncbi:MAG TPA: hypothetical protein VMD02_03580 [Candidatus Omnitrophota bacterium]|nr:hypothetical protein [Candidatus Omnitrophota bacterium]
MAKLAEALAYENNEDKTFVGTIAFRNEQLTLPDGSTIALGIDRAHWVVVYQKEKGSQFKVFDYDGHTKQFRVDKRNGADEDMKEMKRLIRYFYSNARTEDLITILPSGSVQE